MRFCCCFFYFYFFWHLQSIAKELGTGFWHLGGFKNSTDFRAGTGHGEMLRCFYEFTENRPLRFFDIVHRHDPWQHDDFHASRC